MVHLTPEMYALLHNLPSVSPPLGVTPNFVDPPSKAGVLVALHSTFLPLMIIAVIIRMFVRTRITRQVGWDDYTCCMACLASIIYSWSIFNGIRLGYGRHVWDIRASIGIQVNDIRQMTAEIVTYPLVVIFIKLSILLLYRRVFWVNKLQRWGVIVGYVLLVIFYGPYLATQIYSNRVCKSQMAVSQNRFCGTKWSSISCGIVNVITDMYILILPLPYLVRLAAPTRRKIGLCCIFLAGAVACAISIARLIMICKTLKLTDFTWSMSLTSQLSVAEINIAIICSCMTTMPVFVTRLKAMVVSLRSRVHFRKLSKEDSNTTGESNTSAVSSNDQESRSNNTDPIVFKGATERATSKEMTHTELPMANTIG